LLCLVAALSTASASAAQEAAEWNHDRVLELLDRARALRASVAVDSAFRSYKAEARGYVYFFVERPDSAAQVLVKADQVALDVYWRAPNATKQHIVGLRDQKVLPTDIRYHLDHLTVVQDDFGDFIRLGDGDEVERVPHPVGASGGGSYDFLLSDSLTISYGGGAEEVRVYEVRVRPKSFDQPGFVGTVYLDRDRGAIVRMNFSFTPASYVDPYLDYIRISLDNALWLGSYWLPYRQEVEIRREIPLLDFLAGSIIRGRFAIGAYDFNVTLANSIFRGRPVSSMPVEQRETFPFERGLFDDLEEEGGLRPSPTMQEVREQVREVVEDEVLSGLDPLRLHLSGMSDVARYNRAEGVFLGAGLSLRPSARVLARTTAGYAFGRRRGSASVSLTREGGAPGPALDAYWDRMEDIGGHPGATRLENTISALSGDKDYLDPYFARGIRISLPTALPGALSLGARWEKHVSARDVVSDGPDSGFRPVLPIHDGVLLAVDVSARVAVASGGVLRLAGTAGRLGGQKEFVGGVADASWELQRADDTWKLGLFLSGGVTNRGAPAQNMFLIGGRHTLPGHDYRAFVGNGYWLARVEGTVPVRWPYVGVRVFGVAGATYLGDVTLPDGWSATDSRGVRGSVGVGLSVGWDALRIDVGRAVRGGGWEGVFSVAPQFRSWM
jgi:hypothetical protein